MPNKNIRSLEVIDTQAGGDVSRIVMGGVHQLPGDSLLEQARFLAREGDGLRKLLLSDPYGDPAMSVDLIVRPIHPQAQAGYIVMETMGYPVYSGSNTICTATALLESQRLPLKDGEQNIVLESPAGIVHVKAYAKDGHVTSVTCEGSPAFVADLDQKVHVPGFGEVHFDLVYSGGFYALVEAQEVGLELEKSAEPELAFFGKSFIEAARKITSQQHPEMGDIGPVSFLHLKGPVSKKSPDLWRSKGATYVHPGVICRSPTGTGTSARLAVLKEKGEIQDGHKLENISPRGSSFIGEVIEQTYVKGQKALRSHITGQAWTLARSEIVVDLNDPLIEREGLDRILKQT